MDHIAAPGIGCVPETILRIEAAETLDSLPDSARALFGGDAFSTLDWYRSVIDAGLEPGACPSFQSGWQGDRVLCVVPMLRSEALT